MSSFDFDFCFSDVLALRASLGLIYWTWSPDLLPSLAPSTGHSGYTPDLLALRASLA